jgi:RHS repeat-associated protein
MVYPTFREEYRYDPRNRRTQVIRVHPAADGEPERRETTTTAYDGAGNVIAEIDALGRTTQHTYDRLNRRIETTDPLGGKTLHAYDLRDNLTALTDAAGNTHRFTYDKVNRMRTEARPLGQTIRYAYDAAGNLTERTDPLNQRQVHTYDAAGRRTKTEAFAAGAGTASRTITFNYDPRGLLTGYDDGTTSATYAYDANGRRSSESVNFGAFSRTVGLSHTPNGRLAGISYPDGASVVYRYDGAGRLNELEHPGGLMRYSAYQWQRATRVELPGDLVRREAFDALQRSTRIEVGTTSNATAVMNHRYTYDGVGNIMQKATREGPTSYAYDALDRLTQATPPAATGLPVEGYTYDAVHNRQSSAHQPGPWSYNGNHELIQWGEGANATSLEYDANGNLVRETRGSTTRTFVYDLFDRLIEVRDNEQPIARYAWDPFARRVKKEVITGATSTTTWTLSIQRGVLAEYDASGTLQADWQWEPDAPWSTGPVAQRTRDGQTLRSHQIHTDHLWTPVALTDAQGTVAWRAQHEAFGSPIIEAGATASTPWRFPGQYADAETGLSWNLWRHYDPRTGRYTQSDPIGLGGGLNLFSYVQSRPSRSYDPNGLKECRCDEGSPDIGAWTVATAGGSIGVVGQIEIMSGTAVNKISGEVCFVSTYCLRGIAVGLSLGAEISEQLLGPKCGRDLSGLEVCVGAEIVPPPPAAGGSIEGCTDFSSGGLSIGVGPGVGVNLFLGVAICYLRVHGCTATPCDCI